MTHLPQKCPNWPNRPGDAPSASAWSPPTAASELLAVAAEVEAAEKAIVAAMTAAAARGDVAFVARALELWTTAPLTAAARELGIKIDRESPPDPLEACPQPEVTQSPAPTDGAGRI